ncbi:LOW QUALITY PROTEIN: receptor-transporting protein 3-like [Rhea pennata]|uniref:LOW QUALITY PROTEIN: receptor-transporting protein 3-like n=1 Tax=Rhea pennata TaxID=8795 RepID=UPI002E270E63
MHITEPWILQEDNTIQVNVLKPHWKEFLQCHAFGKFQCSQCWHMWSPANVHILFHKHWSQRRCWGAVQMRTAFRQACRQCPDPQLEEPDFSQENMARILDNLVLKILQECYHVPVQPSHLVAVVVWRGRTIAPAVRAASSGYAESQGQPRRRLAQST